VAAIDKPEDVTTRLNRMQAELEDLRRRVGLSSAEISSGGVTLTNDAYFQVISADGDRLVRFGQLSEFPDGTPQQGIDLRYQDGRAAITIWDPGATGPDDDQFIGLWNGNQIVLSTDAASGFGLARPWLQIPLSLAPTAQWPSTTSATYAGLLESWSPQHHPWLEARVAISGNPGTAGDARVTVNGVQVGTPFVFDGTNPITGFVSARIDQPYGTLSQVLLEARRTSGANSIFTKMDVWWRQT
jgi:hypothetical protein